MFGSIKHILCKTHFKQYRKANSKVVLKREKRVIYQAIRTQKISLHLNLAKIREHKRLIEGDYYEEVFNRCPGSPISDLYDRVDEITKKIVRYQEIVVILAKKIKDK